MIKLNKVEVYPTIFPDGTSQVWKLDESVLKSDQFDIVWEFSKESEFMHLAQLKALLDSRDEVKPITLTMPFLPYARQDKDVSNSSTFALLVFSHLLNTLKFDRVTVNDPHSAIAKREIKGLAAIYPVSKVVSTFNYFDYEIVCYPDNGAFIKYREIYNLPFVCGEKIRDQETGQIRSYKFHGDVFHKKVLIVDDICDGGATFELLAKALKEKYANKIGLFVTHGLFTKGFSSMKVAGIEQFFTPKGEIS